MLDEKKSNLIAYEITPDQYTFGSQLQGTVLQPDGQWDAYLPTEEDQQKRGLETSNCTSFATLNCAEILFRRLYGRCENNSDRFLGIVAGTTEKGNSPQTVAEAFRRFGAIPETELPFDESIKTSADYYSPKPIPGKYIALGDQWRRAYCLNHDWVLDGKEGVDTLKDALRYSPLGIGVFAWYCNDNGIYERFKSYDNHWTCLVGYKEGEYWKVWDSYRPYIKKLDWNFGIKLAKRYSITDVVENLTQQVSVLQQIVNILKKLIQQKFGLWKN